MFTTRGIKSSTAFVGRLKDSCKTHFKHFVGARLSNTSASMLVFSKLAFVLLLFNYFSVHVHSNRWIRRTPLSDAESAATVLRISWFNPETGLWSNNWWQSANHMTTISLLAAISPSQRKSIEEDIATIALNAYRSGASGSTGWLNNFYDDEGWWALAWIAAYDLTNETAYLKSAIDIFDDMVYGWERDRNTSPCGGLWWDKERSYVTAISNGLFFSVAAHLANRAPGNKQWYLDWALQEWVWFSTIGIINSANLVNDGISLPQCENNGGTTFTIVNQGVAIGALIELNKASPDLSFVDKANEIALATLAKLVDTDGILGEPISDNSDTTTSQFKGIFTRNLRFLHQVSPHPEYVSFIERNARSIWNIARDPVTQKIGPNWQGPYAEPTAPSHGSALDCLVAWGAVSGSSPTNSTLEPKLKTLSMRPKVKRW